MVNTIMFIKNFINHFMIIIHMHANYKLAILIITLVWEVPPAPHPLPLFHPLHPRPLQFPFPLQLPVHSTLLCMPYTNCMIPHLATH